MSQLLRIVVHLYYRYCTSNFKIWTASGSDYPVISFYATLPLAAATHNITDTATIDTISSTAAASSTAAIDLPT
jgi:hypothetical protein